MINGIIEAHFFKTSSIFKNEKNTKTNLLVANVHAVITIRNPSNSHNNLAAFLGGASNINLNRLICIGYQSKTQLYL
jgi:hypothetical protein